MGNQQSQGGSKEDKLLSQWTIEEQEMLNKTKELPAYFSAELFSSLTEHSTRAEYLETGYGLIKGQDPVCGYRVFKNAVERRGASLEKFVSWTVVSAVPLWLNNDDAIQLGDFDPSRLIGYLLDSSKETEREEDDGWLLGESPRGDEGLAEWKTAYEASPSGLSQSEFSHWFESTPAFARLLCLASEQAFLGRMERQDLHLKRINHLVSPELGSMPDSDLLSPYDYFLLTQHLPSHALSNDKPSVTHRRLFSSRQHGESWQVFVNRIVQQGSTLILIRTKDGTVLGGYADEAWEQKTDWYGNSHNFLFRLGPDQSRVWLAQSANPHYQYLCWGKKRLPNGLGMGGQLDYCGLWIDADFLKGHSRAGPRCSTYQSPQLTPNDTFLVDHVEVWLMRPSDKEQEEEGRGALNCSEDMEFMEMAGKKLYSKDLAPPPEKEKQ